MSVAPLDISNSLTGSLNISSTALVISKKSGVTLVHPHGTELPENFEYMKPEESTRMYYLVGSLGFNHLLITKLLFNFFLPNEFSSILEADWICHLSHSTRDYSNCCSTSNIIGLNCISYSITTLQIQQQLSNSITTDSMTTDPTTIDSMTTQLRTTDSINLISSFSYTLQYVRYLTFCEVYLKSIK